MFGIIEEDMGGRVPYRKKPHKLGEILT